MVDGTEDLVELANGSLVLEEDLGVEVRDLGVRGLADHLAFAGVHERAKLEDLGWRTEVTLLETATTACKGDDVLVIQLLDVQNIHVHLRICEFACTHGMNSLTTASATATKTAPSSGRTSERHYDVQGIRQLMGCRLCCPVDCLSRIVVEISFADGGFGTGGRLSLTH